MASEESLDTSGSMRADTSYKRKIILFLIATI